MRIDELIQEARHGEIVGTASGLQTEGCGGDGGGVEAVKKQHDRNLFIILLQYARTLVVYIVCMLSIVRTIRYA